VVPFASAGEDPATILALRRGDARAHVFEALLCASETFSGRWSGTTEEL
jgi:hypothetical protein